MPYIGTSPSNGVRRKHTYTATASQTSFSGAGAEGATLSYNDSNFVDVYQNGVKLSEADYTSTSGTAIVLATGATVSDMIEIVVYDVFSVSDTVSKSAGGTFDGAVTLAGGVSGVLDADGGITVDNITIDGTEIDLSSGDLTLDVAGNITLDADGGDIFLKDGGTNIGQIALNNSGYFDIYSAVQDADVRIRGNDGGSTVTAFTLDMSDGGAATLNNGLTLTDGNLVVANGHGIDFSANTGQSGQSSEIFHHYEEGTWTPQVYSNVTQIATSSVYGFYTKVGDLVHINGQVSRNDSASLSSTFLLKNLPFTSKSGTGCIYVNGGFWFDKASATDEVGFGYMSGGTTTVYVKTLNLSAAYITADALENSRPVYFAFTYKTAT